MLSGLLTKGTFSCFVLVYILYELIYIYILHFGLHVARFMPLKRLQHFPVYLVERANEFSLIIELLILTRYCLPNTERDRWLLNENTVDET